MTFNDIFKSGFLDNMSAVTIPDMVLAMVLALAIGLFIFFVYGKAYRGVMYSQSFGVTLVALTLISTLVILAVSSNVVLSLGMVGALSIVRFRAAIKDPLDIAFLFWAIAVGIVLAAGMIPLAVIGSAVIGVVLLSFARRKPNDAPYILVVSCVDAEAEANAERYISDSVRRLRVKSKTVAPDHIDLNYEVRLREGDAAFVSDLSRIGGVTNTVLVSYDGEYTG